MANAISNARYRGSHRHRAGVDTKEIHYDARRGWDGVDRAWTDPQQQGNTPTMAIAGSSNRLACQAAFARSRVTRRAEATACLE